MYVYYFVSNKIKKLTNLLNTTVTVVEAPGWRATLSNPLSAFGGSPDEAGGEMYNCGICADYVRIGSTTTHAQSYLSTRNATGVLQRECYLHPGVLQPVFSGQLSITSAKLCWLIGRTNYSGGYQDLSAEFLPKLLA
jgi:hypothetical protein